MAANVRLLYEPAQPAVKLKLIKALNFSKL